MVMNCSSDAKHKVQKQARNSYLHLTNTVFYNCITENPKFRTKIFLSTYSVTQHSTAVLYANLFLSLSKVAWSA